MCCSPQVLTRYLQEIEDLEVRLQLATEAEMFDIGIDVSFFLMAWTILLVTWLFGLMYTYEECCLLCPPHTVYCGYFACVGTAATEGWWETGWLHQPDPSSPHGQTQTVPWEDRVSTRKLSESSVVSDRLVSFPGCVRGERVLCVWYRCSCAWHYVTVCYPSAANQVEVNEWLAISELYSTNNYVNVHILFVVR